jgi:hypothetical protein
MQVVRTILHVDKLSTVVDGGSEGGRDERAIEVAEGVRNDFDFQSTG